MSKIQFTDFNADQNREQLELVKQRIQFNKQRVEYLYQKFVKQATLLQKQGIHTEQLEQDFLKILKIYFVGIGSVNPSIIEIFLEHIKFHEPTIIQKILKDDPELRLQIDLIRDRIHQIESKIINKSYRDP